MAISLITRWSASVTGVVHRPRFRTFVFGVAIGVVAALAADLILGTAKAVFFGPESTEAIKQLVRDEAQFARQAPYAPDSYAALFSENALVVDVGGRQRFTGRGQIARRFLALPKFTTLVHDLVEEPAIRGDSAAAASLSTIEFDGRQYTGSEIWLFVRVDGQWKIDRLFFNNPN